VRILSKPNGNRVSMHLSAKDFLSGSVLIVGALALLTGMMMTGVYASASQGGQKVGAFPTEGRVGDRMGVASPHAYWDPPDELEKEFQYMKGAGIEWLRCTFPWVDIESTQGIWDWSRMDAMVQKAQEKGIRILGVLISAPPWANALGEGNNTWDYPPDVHNAAKLGLWKTYVGNVCTRYKDIIDHWEVYNEQDTDFVWKPTPNVPDYITLLQATSQKIHEVDPDDFVVLGGLAGARPEVMEQYLAAGAAEYIDAIAYHPYPCTWSSGVPDEATCRSKLDAMHSLITQYSPNKDLEVWLTELGFFTSGYFWSFPVNEPTQASYVMRTMLLYANLDVDKVFYNSMKDEIPGIWFVYDTTGLLNVDPNRPLGPTGGYPYAITVPKPSYHYFDTMMEVYKEAISEDKYAVSYSCNNPATLEAYNFILPDGDLAIAAWKTDGLADSLSFTVADPSYENPKSVKPSSGQEQATPGASRDAQGRVTVSALPIGVVNTNDPDLSSNPVIIKLNKGAGGVAVTSITPNSAAQGASVDITNLTGGGFKAGATVRLEMSGQAPINATNVVVVSPSKITCTFNLTNAAAGSYDVVVVNPDNTQGRLTGGFTVTSCGQGAAASALSFGIMMGLLSLAGFGGLRRRSRRFPR